MTHHHTLSSVARIVAIMAIFMIDSIPAISAFTFPTSDSTSSSSNSAGHPSIAGGGAARGEEGLTSLTSWLFNETVSLLVGCQLTGIGNVQLFTPDASSSYGAQWTRDFTFALDNAPLAMKTIISDARLGDAVAYTLTRILPAGMVPDRVTSSGASVFSPGGGTWASHLAWDNMAFAGLMLAAYTEKYNTNNSAAAQTFFCSNEPIVRNATQFMNLTSTNGLAYNSESAPNCSWGFMDTVIVTREMLFVSLLQYESASRMSALSEKYASAECGSAEMTAFYTQIAQQISTNIDLLLDKSGDTPLFLSSLGVDSLPDVWGSSYAAYLGLSSIATKQGIANWIAAQYQSGAGAPSIFQEGQVRHLPQPLTWKDCFPGSCPANGTYQNGAYWSTPLRWVVPVLASYGHADVAQDILLDVLTSFQKGGVMECINRNLSYTGVKDYVASATNVLAAANDFLEIVSKV